jgi:hypothetical protein
MGRALVVLVLSCRGRYEANPVFHYPEVTSGSGTTVHREAIDAKLPGKAASHNLQRTVPETDTGRQVENTKAHERTRVKELGKMVP